MFHQKITKLGCVKNGHAFSAAIQVGDAANPPWHIDVEHHVAIMTFSLLSWFFLRLGWVWHCPRRKQAHAHGVVLQRRVRHDAYMATKSGAYLRAAASPKARALPSRVLCDEVAKAVAVGDLQRTVGATPEVCHGSTPSGLRRVEHAVAVHAISQGPLLRIHMLFRLLLKSRSRSHSRNLRCNHSCNLLIGDVLFSFCNI